MDIPEMTWTDFKNKKASDIEKYKSLNVMSNGSLLFIAVIPRTDYVREDTNELCVLSNSVGGIDP
jgi:hypothetical protein